MSKLFQRRKAPKSEPSEKTELEMFNELETAMDKIFQKANELSEAITNTPYALTLTVTRTKFWITEERRAGDTYSFQGERENERDNR